MPRLSDNYVPSYRLHRQSGQAVVTLSGRDFLLGPYNTSASRAEYRRLIAEWVAAGRQLPKAQTDLTISELIVRYKAHIDVYYRHPDGSPTGEADVISHALRPLFKVYRDLPAAEFSPMKLKSVRETMIHPDPASQGGGWARGTVNKQVNRIRAMFKWAAENELLPAEIYHGLQAVSALKRGRTDARETAPVEPVSDATVDATLPFLPEVVRAMVRLQRLTGARPGEICLMKTGEIDRTGEIWAYTPASHKTQYRGHRRMIFIGPRGQKIMTPYLRLDPQAYCFCPIESERQRREAARRARTELKEPRNRPSSNRRQNRNRPPGDHYDTTAYNRAIARATHRAFPPPDNLAREEGESVAGWMKRLTAEQHKELRVWRRKHSWHVHQLRHSAGTQVRARFGLEAAGAMLGHTELSATQIYAQRNNDAARQIAAVIG